MVGTVWAQPTPTQLTASASVSGGNPMGRVYYLDAAAGLTVTLPATTGRGDRYVFVVTTTVTSNSYIIKVANATDVIQGVLAVSTDAAGVTIPTASTTDTITMSGSTTGGVIGSTIILQDVKSGVWAVTGGLVSTGAEATPFSATVS